jgi:hypothetical protein
MKRFLYTLAAICLCSAAFSQDITGLWKGTIYNDSTQKSLPYEIVISKENGKLTGWSHTSFMVNNQVYYGIKKVKVRMAKDGKIVIQDAALLDNNYPAIDKNVYQLNVLDLQAANNNEMVLDGPFATNRSKQYGELTGHINIKKVSSSTESALMDYLQKSGTDNGIAALK